MYNIKLDHIIRKYPFMYEVEEELYYIGYHVFKKCDNPLAVQCFRKYQSAIQSLDRHKLADKMLDVSETEDLVYYFRKVKAYSEVLPEDNDYRTSNQEASVFLDTLNEKAQNDLLEQLENYVYTFGYYSRAF